MNFLYGENHNLNGKMIKKRILNYIHSFAMSAGVIEKG